MKKTFKLDIHTKGVGVGCQRTTTMYKPLITLILKSGKDVHFWSSYMIMSYEVIVR